MPASVRARALESVRTCEKSAPAFFVEKRSEDEKIEDKKEGVFAYARESGSKKTVESRVLDVFLLLCVHTPPREWVRGCKKERFQSKKVEKDTPHIIKPHQVRAWSDRSFVFFSRGAAWGAEESSSRNRAERSAVSFSISVSPRRRIESDRIARLEFQKIDNI